MESYSTSEIGSAQGSRVDNAQGKACPTDLPQETDSSRQTTTDSGRGGITISISRQEERAKSPIAVLSVDEYGALIAINGTKFAYYQKTERQDKTREVPKEYKGHPAFEPKHLEGLPEHGP
ncbi:hypothetical protein MYCTH_62778 [Thermothelomyces thermophilus ATCC 42464]|uniref:Uncharacterized protein n=1 Tax=Thermothelomyces thermophilus (strain ATCC 42464 / BCRC 31852 / DSM 1799) TaxID=573729 RepID=G2Q5F9_THET4|nr:uncharacterized protein MYCTH_62778 [Thermothelomyces thermophilus ATCC 42464]AEO53790.1 hypothetical protein MYCTH_62778 [Thermothelomyces thermophilus ATCC 42464]